MRTIYAELTAEQKKLRVRPAIGGDSAWTSFEAARPKWTQIATNTEATRMYDACVCKDGALLLARISGGNCQVKRIADPTDAADWASASWVDVGTGTNGNRVSICTHMQAPSTVFVCWAGTSNTVLRWSTSTDNGATWAAAADIYTFAAGTISALAFVMRTSGSTDRYIFIASTNAGVVSWWVISRTSGGSWPAAPTAIATGWPAAYSCNGLSGVVDGDFLFLSAGQTTATGNGARLWWMVYGDGDTYTAGTAASGVMEQTDTANFAYVGPRLIAGDHVRCGYLESWTGTGAFRRQVLRSLLGTGSEFNACNWTEPEPFPMTPTSDYSASLAALQTSTNTLLWVYAPQFAGWMGVLAGYSSIDGRVIRYDYREDVDTCRLQVDLDNSDDALDLFGFAGDYEYLTPGAMMLLTHGLTVAGVDKTDPMQWLKIDNIRRVHDGKGRKWLEVNCIGWPDLLGLWKAEKVYQWAASSLTLAGIITRITGRVGLDFSQSPAGGDALYTALMPAYILQAGVNGYAAVRRLVGWGPDVLAFDGSFALMNRSISRSEAAVYSVGGDGEHPIILGEFVEGGVPVNAVEVYGAAAALGTAVEADDIWSMGVRRGRVYDGVYTAAADAQTRADGEIEKSIQVEASAGWIDVLPIHGLEMWDVLSVTYDLQQIGARRYRVVSIREIWDSQRAHYRQRIGLVALEAFAVAGV